MFLFLGSFLLLFLPVPSSFHFSLLFSVHFLSAFCLLGVFLSSGISFPLHYFHPPLFFHHSSFSSLLLHLSLSRSVFPVSPTGDHITQGVSVEEEEEEGSREEVGREIRFQISSALLCLPPPPHPQRPGDRVAEPGRKTCNPPSSSSSIRPPSLLQHSR